MASARREQQARFSGRHAIDQVYGIEHRAEAAQVARREFGVLEVRRGLMIAIELHPETGGARTNCERSADLGLPCKESRKDTIRIAPPLRACLLLRNKAISSAIPIGECASAFFEGNRRPSSRRHGGKKNDRRQLVIGIIIAPPSGNDIDITEYQR